MNRKLLKTINRQYKKDVKSIGDVEEIGNVYQLDSFALIGKLRLKILFIPLYYFIFKRNNSILYKRSLSKVISEVNSNDSVFKLFDIYDILLKRKFGYLTFASQYKAPEEFKEVDIPQEQRQALIIQHFQDSASKIVVDISNTEIVDIVNVDSLADTSTLELHLDPIGLYELVSLEELKIKSLVINSIYLLIFLGTILISIL